MHLTELPIAALHPHPHNSNVMPERLFARLVEHIANTNTYPPIIVRPLQATQETQATQQAYQILDGHHRVRALRELGRTHARCDVWAVDDQQALMLLATLNRLEGSDDPLRRADLLRSLAAHVDPAALSKLLPEGRRELERLLALRPSPPRPAPPVALAQMPVPVCFFLLPADRDALERELRQTGLQREEALMRLVAGGL